jgi:hypothetical protein
MGTGSFPGVRCGQGVTLTTHLLLMPRSKIGHKGLRAFVAYERVKPTLAINSFEIINSLKMCYV